jgi:hypothetical protein
MVSPGFGSDVLPRVSFEGVFIGSGMRMLRVKNFERFQHYRDRNPTWIKLYNALLDDYAFACLSDAGKAHLIMVWLLASRYDNRIPADMVWIGKRINATETVDIPALVSSGFLEEYDCASNTVPDGYGSAIPERERELEGEKETPLTPLSGGGGVPDGTPEPACGTAPESEPDPQGFAEWWGEYPRHERKVGKSKCRREWKRRKLEPIAGKVVEALRRDKASAGWRKQGGAFIPMPMTWLNRTPWESAASDVAGAAVDDNGFQRRTVTQEDVDFAEGVTGEGE